MINAKFELIEFKAGTQFVLHRVHKINTRPHWHREIELIYVESGCVQMTIEDRQIDIFPNYLAVINHEQIHTIKSENTEAIILQFSEHLVKSLGQSSNTIAVENPINISNSNAGDKHEEHRESVAGIRQCVDEITNELEKGSMESYNNLNLICHRLLALLIRWYNRYDGTQKPRMVSRTQERIKQVFAFVNNNYMREFSQKEVADSIGVNPSYLSSLFTSYTNTSFAKYVNAYRIERICSELISTNDSITDIYLQNGFTNAKTFNRVFRNLMGISPREYRMNATTHDGYEIPVQLRTETSVGTYVNVSGGWGDSSHNLESQEIYYTQPDLPSGCESNRFAIDPMANGKKLVNPACRMICTGRAHDFLMTKWRQHFEICQRSFNFEYIRFHGLLNDEIGLVCRGNEGIYYNYFYVDEVIQYILSQKCKPYIGLTFMPFALASGNSTIFAYHSNITMPRDISEWEKMISELVRHLIEYFGRNEVKKWYFEVWNEPDIKDFFDGTFDDYLLLYETSFRALKAIDPELRVGGPSGSSVLFQTRDKLKIFLDYIDNNNMPLSFLSLHPYPAQFMQRKNRVSSLERLCPVEYTVESMQWAKAQLDSAHMNDVPLHMNEWNSSPRYDDYVHDTAFMATYVIDTALRCDSLCDMLGWWTVSDLMDEGGIAFREFGGGFGLLNRNGLKKPAFFGLWALNKLGDSYLMHMDDCIVTKKDNHILLLMWNHAFYKADFAAGNRSGLNYYERYNIFEDAANRHFSFEIQNTSGCRLSITKYRFDRNHGCAFDFWLEHGAVEYMQEAYLNMLIENNHLETQTFFVRDVSRLLIDEEVQRFGFTLYDIEITKL